MKRSSTTDGLFPLVLVACLLVSACGPEEKTGDTEAAHPDASSHDGVVLEPADLERPPHSFAALPGGALTFFLPSPDPRDAGAFVSPDDPLHAAFLAKAEEALETLEYDGTPIRDLMTRDPDLRRIWDEAVSRVRVTRSRPQADGTYIVVLQADLKDVYLRVR